MTVEDDAPDTVTVTFGAASYTVAEGSSRTVTVSLDADPERTVTIPIETANEGGASDSDYSGVPENVTFEAGDTSKTFDVSATEDNLAEAGEKVKLSFGALPTDATAGTPGETTVSIHDRTQGQNLPTPPTVHFENATYSVDEGASTSIKVILSKAPGSEAVIPISRANRAGATDPDYSGVPDTLTFGATDTEKTITFAATDDEVDDDGEKVDLSFGTLPGGITATSGEAAEATVAITDNDETAAIVLDPESVTVEEGDDTGDSYTVKLSTQPSETVTVAIGGHSGTDLSISGTTLSSNQLTFTASNWDTAQTVTVKAGHDGDSDDESESLTHTASGGDYANVTKNLPVPRWTDDAPDTVTVTFGAASYTVAEGSSRTVTVSLDEDPERTVTIPIETANEGGASDSDYTGVPENVTFEAGDTSKTFDVSATEDNLAEAGEKVKLSFGAAPNRRDGGHSRRDHRLHTRPDPGAGPADSADRPLRERYAYSGQTRELPPP